MSIQQTFLLEKKVIGDAEKSSTYSLKPFFLANTKIRDTLVQLLDIKDHVDMAFYASNIKKYDVIDYIKQREIRMKLGDDCGIDIHRMEE